MGIPCYPWFSLIYLNRFITIKIIVKLTLYYDVKSCSLPYFRNAVKHDHCTMGAPGPLDVEVVDRV